MAAPLARPAWTQREVSSTFIASDGAYPAKWVDSLEERSPRVGARCDGGCGDGAGLG